LTAESSLTPRVGTPAPVEVPREAQEAFRKHGEFLAQHPELLQRARLDVPVTPAVPDPANAQTGIAVVAAVH
jgi:hypothetical protein